MSWGSAWTGPLKRSPGNICGLVQLYFLDHSMCLRLKKLSAGKVSGKKRTGVNTKDTSVQYLRSGFGVPEDSMPLLGNQLQMGQSP